MKPKSWLLPALLCIPALVHAVETVSPTRSLASPGGVALIQPPPEDGLCGDRVLSHHDATAEGAYAWILSGVEPPDYGAFAECFEGRYLICEVQIFLTQVGHQSGQTMDVFIWDDSGTGSPGNVLAMMPGVDPGPVAEWPETSRHDFSLPLFVRHDWWVGYWGNWPDAIEGWFVAADEDGPGGCPRTKIAPGIGYPTGWEHPDIVSSWADCKSLGIQVQAKDAPPTATPVSTAPLPEGGIEIDSQAGGCADPTVMKNHDGTVENAYTWVQTGVTPPDYGAFAECFEGSAAICELQFFFAQIGDYSGQTMDVYVWEDTGVESPGNVIATLRGVNPGPISAWPSISQHNIPLPLVVTGRWWVGYWGNWPGQEAGWFVAADENGPGGCPRTKIAPGIGYPTGWEHPSTIFSWENCKSLAIQVVTDASASVDEPRDAPSSRVLTAVSPSPFARTTEIEFELQRGAHVNLAVYDVSGRRVKTLLDQHVDAGAHRVVWDGTEAIGGHAAGGVYYVKIRTESAEETHRVVLMN